MAINLGKADKNSSGPSINLVKGPVQKPVRYTIRKQGPDLYTALLVIALLAILTAIVFLWLELKAYDFQSKGGPAVTLIHSIRKSVVVPPNHGFSLAHPFFGAGALGRYLA